MELVLLNDKVEMETYILNVKERIENGPYPFTYYMGDRCNTPFDMRFETCLGTSELCHATRKVRVDGPNISDHWFEYEDRYGDLHYGR